MAYPSVRGVDDLLLPDWTPPLHSNSVTELTCYTNKKQHKKKKICLDWKQWKLNWLVFSFKGAPQNQSSENVFASQINPATQLVSASAPIPASLLSQISGLWSVVMFQPAWTTLAAKRLHSGPTLEVVLGVHILSSPWSKTNVVYRPVCLLCKCQLPPMQEKQQKCTCGGNGRWILVTVYAENKISNLPPLKTFCPTLSQWPCTSRLKLRCSLCCPCARFFFS